jgi:hypothetical protein
VPAVPPAARDALSRAEREAQELEREAQRLERAAEQVERDALRAAQAAQRRVQRDAEHSQRHAERAVRDAQRLARDAGRAEREAGRAEREAMRAELSAARAALADAARKLAQAQRQLLESGERHARWRIGTNGDAEQLEIVIEEAVEDDMAGGVPRLGVIVRDGGDREVLGLTPGGGAAAAGVRRGDRILAVNGSELDDATGIAEALRGVDAGETVPLRIARGDDTLTLEVRTSAPERDIRVFARRFAAGDDVDFEFDTEFETEFETGSDSEFDVDVEVSGPDTEPMQRQIVRVRKGTATVPPAAPLPGLLALDGDVDLISNHAGLEPYFGTGEGVLVLRIEAGNSLGLVSGDVVLQMDGDPLAHPVDLARALLDRQPGEPVQLELLRRGRRVDVEGRVPASRLPTVPAPPVSSQSGGRVSVARTAAGGVARVAPGGR